MCMRTWMLFCVVSVHMTVNVSVRANVRANACVILRVSGYASAHVIFCVSVHMIVLANVRTCQFACKCTCKCAHLWTIREC